jgi:hypothetical protein
MASIIRDIADAQAPGLLFGEGSAGVNYSAIVKEGVLEKMGRGRGLVSAIVGKKWATRNFRLHEDGKVYYLEGTNPKGEFTVAKGPILQVTKEAADSREHAFEIPTTDGEKVLCAAETADEVADWLAKLELVASGKLKLFRHTDLLAEYLKIDLAGGRRISVDIDDADLLAAMQADSYEASRLVEIVEEYLKELNAKVVRLVAEDAEFAVLFRQKFTALRIHIKKAVDEDTSRGYYRTAFVDGSLEIQFIRAWTNLSNLGEDLPVSISAGEAVPYSVAKSIRQRQPILDANLQAIDQLLQIQGVQFDYCLEENLKAMRAANYEDSRFADIFFYEHLRPLIERLARFIASDPQFRTDFNAKFVGKLIVIRPGVADTLDRYYQSSFTVDGNLLIEYKQFWCNINELGADLEKVIVSDGSYEAQKSMRQNQHKLTVYLQAIEGLLGITGVTYDYCYNLNFPVMVQYGYGEDRFGEIFFEEHLKPIVQRLTMFISQDIEFRNAFARKFYGRKLIIRPSTSPETMRTYYDSSFVDGNLLIEYKRFWCNINEMGADFESLL